MFFNCVKRECVYKRNVLCFVALYKFSNVIKVNLNTEEYIIQHSIYLRNKITVATLWYPSLILEATDWWKGNWLSNR